MEWVRPGLMLYGISPFAAAAASEFDLRPVMTLLTPLIAVRDVKAGESVGYGGTWTTHAMAASVSPRSVMEMGTAADR